MMSINKHCDCFLLMLLVFAMKCCTKMLCPMPHNHYCCLLPSPIYACLTCSSVHASSHHPLLAHHHLCFVDVYCVLFFFCFICCISLWLHFGLFVYIVSLSFLFLCHSPFFFNWLANVFLISWLYCFSIAVTNPCFIIKKSQANLYLIWCSQFKTQPVVYHVKTKFHEIHMLTQSM